MAEPIPFPSAVTPVRRALISVHDKTGDRRARRARSRRRGVELVSTGGTAAHLKQAGVPVALVEETTGFPEILGGRVKTLHPKIFGGVLADDSREDHARDLPRAAHRGRSTSSSSTSTPSRRPSPRASGRSEVDRDDRHRRAGAWSAPPPRTTRASPSSSDPADYDAVLEEIRRRGGTSSRHARAPGRPRLRPHRRLRRRDRRLLRERASGEPYDLPGEPRLRLRARRRPALRREPAPARGALPRAARRPPDALVRFQMLQGKELSFNNLLDLDSAVHARARLRRARPPSSSSTTTRAAPRIGDTISEAFGRAFACDPLAAFGGIIAIRGRVDGALASLVLQHFVEVVAADDFTEEAIAFFAKKPNIRLLRVPVSRRAARGPRLEADRGRPAPPGRGRRARPELVLEARLAAQADGRRARRLRARLEGRAPRQVERHRARQRPPDDRHRRRPDEPRRRLPPRGDQARAADRQLRRRLRRVLPVPRRPRHPRARRA